MRAATRSHERRPPAYMQVTRSTDGGLHWSRFEPVLIQGYEPAHGDIYFFNVAANPVHRGTWTGIFQLWHAPRASRCALAAAR